MVQTNWTACLVRRTFFEKQNPESSPRPFGVSGAHAFFQLASSKTPPRFESQVSHHHCQVAIVEPTGPFRGMLCCIRQSILSILTDCLATIGRAIFGETWKPSRRSDGTICNGIFGRIIIFCTSWTLGSERHQRSATMVDAHW